MDLLIHVGFGEPVAFRFAEALNLGFRWIINGPIVTDQASEAHMTALLDEFAQPGAPKLLWKAHSADIAEFGAQSGIPSAIEVFGEPDLDWSSHGWVDYSHDPVGYGVLLLESYDRIRQHMPDVPILGGNVSGLSVRGRTYLVDLDPDTWPADIALNFHGYPVSWPQNNVLEPPYVGHDGLYLRAVEWQWLHGIRGDRPLWNSEFGYSNGIHTRFQPEHDLDGRIDLTFAWSEQDTSRYTVIDLDMQKDNGVQVSGIYQWADDPRLPEDIKGCYGLHRADGSEKPICNALRSWVVANP